MDNPEKTLPLGKTKKQKRSEASDKQPASPTQAGETECANAAPASETKSLPAAQPPEPQQESINRPQGIRPVPAKAPHAVTLSDVVWERLQQQTEKSFWKIEALVEQIIRDTLHGAYPAITYGELCLANARHYRSFDRLNYCPAMLLTSDVGEFLIRIRTENPDYVHWCEIYQGRGEIAAEAKAAEMAVFLLQQRLQENPTPGTVHAIFPDDFIIERILPPAAE